MSKSFDEECITRLNMLIDQGVLTDINILKLFEKGELCVSEANMILGEPCGVILNLKEKSKYYEIFKNKVEGDINGKPYFIMVQNTSFGLLMSVLFVSVYAEEWEMDRESLAEHEPLAFVYNINEKFGEVGYIKYDIFNGGPIRTA